MIPNNVLFQAVTFDGGFDKLHPGEKVVVRELARDSGREGLGSENHGGGSHGCGSSGLI